jgi:hypothetical protein
VVFSGKITNSVIKFLHKQSIELGKECDLDSLIEAVDVPAEFLKDPTCWLDAQKVENFLRAVVAHCELQLNFSDVFEKVGHNATELKTWGVLDSVLRMIEKPPDIYHQPQRFISYFVSPAPPIANITRSENSISFDVPIFYEEFPYVVTYLKSAMEAVPSFMGLPMADVKWAENRISIQWSENQALLNEENFQRRHMAPEVMENLINTLEKTEQALVEKSRELDRIKVENAMAAQSKPVTRDQFVLSTQNIKKIQEQLFRLQDYFTRSQQLVTLLVGQDRMSPQVREAMKRVNWENIQSSYAEVSQEILEVIQNKNLSTPFQGDFNVQNQQNISP